MYDNIRSAIAYGIRPVVGTTGLSPAQLEELADFAPKVGNKELLPEMVEEDSFLPEEPVHLTKEGYLVPPEEGEGEVVIPPAKPVEILEETVTPEIAIPVPAIKEPGPAL